MQGYYKTSLSIIISSFFVVIFIIQYNDVNFTDKITSKLNLQTNVVPNIVHYIIFGRYDIDFATYLSILSSVKVQKPTTIYIHSDNLNFSGPYWDRVKKLNESQSVITVSHMPIPTHVFGQRLSSVYHATDVARIATLKKWGGVYLDTDTLILKDLYEFRKYEMVVGWPINEALGTQILLAKKNARFLNAWLDGYKRYVPSKWYYNAGEYPTEQILKKAPYLIYRVPELFGVQNLLEQLYNVRNWSHWRQFYAIHLLSRHPPATQYMNETMVFSMNNTFGEIARFLLQL